MSERSPLAEAEGEVALVIEHLLRIRDAISQGEPRSKEQAAAFEEWTAWTLARLDEVASSTADYGFTPEWEERFDDPEAARRQLASALAHLDAHRSALEALQATFERRRLELP